MSGGISVSAALAASEQPEAARLFGSVAAPGPAQIAAYADPACLLDAAPALRAFSASSVLRLVAAPPNRCAIIAAPAVRTLVKRTITRTSKAS